MPSHRKLTALSASLPICFLIAATAAFRFAQQSSSTSRQSPDDAVCVLPAASAPLLRCVRFEGHSYAVADVNLRSHGIVITTTPNRMEAFPAVASQLEQSGIHPILVTNAGIYGTDYRALGLLISPAGKIHALNNASGTTGNFSWDSAVFQVLDDGTASIIPATNWQQNAHAIAATQSGPQLATLGKINRSIPPRSTRMYLRTAVGIDASDPRLVHLVVSEDPITLFALANFMAGGIHCSEALHLDGDLSAFYIPSKRKYVFSDPGERIVTVISVVAKTGKILPK